MIITDSYGKDNALGYCFSRSNYKGSTFLNVKCDVVVDENIIVVEQFAVSGDQQAECTSYLTINDAKHMIQKLQEAISTIKKK